MGLRILCHRAPLKCLGSALKTSGAVSANRGQCSISGLGTSVHSFIIDLSVALSRGYEGLGIVWWGCNRDLILTICKEVLFILITGMNQSVALDTTGLDLPP